MKADEPRKETMRRTVHRILPIESVKYKIIKDKGLFSFIIRLAGIIRTRDQISERGVIFNLTTSLLSPHCFARQRLVSEYRYTIGKAEFAIPGAVFQLSLHNVFKILIFMCLLRFHSTVKLSYYFLRFHFKKERQSFSRCWVV